MENEQIVFDEDACAEHIFNKLIERGVAVRIEDIRLIMDLEYEYGESIGIYPSQGEDHNEQVISIVKENGGVSLSIGEMEQDEAIEILEESIRTIKAFRG